MQLLRILRIKNLRGSAGVTAGPSCSWNFLDFALCLKCLKFKCFWNWLFTHRRSCEVGRKQAWSAVVLQLSYSMNPDWVNKKGKRKQFQSTAWLRNNRILRLLSNILKSTPLNSQKERIDTYCPTFKPGKYGQATIHKCSICRKVKYSSKSTEYSQAG
jgi:hypothetical protein